MRYYNDMGQEVTSDVEKLKAENIKLSIDLNAAYSKIAQLERAAKRKEVKPDGKA